MALHDRFYGAWINRQDHRVLGRRLRAFCLYDWVALDFAGSPFLPGAEARAINYADLRLAVRVCTARPGAALNPSFFQTSGWREIWAGLRSRGWRRIEDPGAAFRDECDKFFLYLADHFSGPMWCEDDGGPAPKLPVWLVIGARVEKATGWSEEAVWGMPLGRLLHRAAAYALLDRAGEDLVPPEEEEAMREMGLLGDAPGNGGDPGVTKQKEAGDVED